MCGGLHKKKDYLYPSQAITSNLNPNQPFSHCNNYAHDVNHCFTLHPKLQQVNANKGQKGRTAPNQNLVTKWAPNLSNI